MLKALMCIGQNINPETVNVLHWTNPEFNSNRNSLQMFYIGQIQEKGPGCTLKKSLLSCIR